MAFSADEIRSNRDYFAHKLRAEKQRNDVLHAVEGGKFDFVLLDMELEGATIMQEISVREPGDARLPVIALTPRGDLKSKLTSFEAGVQDILTLPFAPEELLESPDSTFPSSSAAATA